MLLLTAPSEDESGDDATTEEAALEISQAGDVITWENKDWKAEMRELGSNVENTRVLVCGILSSDNLQNVSNALEPMRFDELYALVGRTKSCFCDECKREDPLGPYVMEHLHRISLGMRLHEPRVQVRPVVLPALNGKDIRSACSNGFACTRGGELYRWSKSGDNVDLVEPMHTSNIHCSKVAMNNDGVCCALVAARPESPRVNSHIVLFTRDGTGLSSPTILWPSHENSEFSHICISDSRAIIVDAQGAVFELDITSMADQSNPLEPLKMRDRIRLMYLKYAPLKLHTKPGFLDKLLQQYVDREEELLHLLMQNYGAEPALDEIVDPVGFARSHPILVQGPLFKRRIVSASCSKNIVLAVSHAGHLFSWSAIGSTPKELQIFDKSGRNERIAQASCGHRHCVALTKQGKVYTWGEGRFGQLGHGDRQSRKDPTMVEMKRVKIVKIDAGNYHTACLTMDGECQVFGCGAQGQLGLGDVKDRLSPCVVQLREGSVELRVLDVSCSATSTVFVARRPRKQQRHDRS